MTPQEELKEAQKQRYIEFAKNSVNINNPTSKPIKVKYTKKQVCDFLDAPYVYYNRLQQISQWLMGKNGIYYRLIKYMSNLLTYDYTIYPAIGADKFENKDKILKSYEDCALFLDKMQIKLNLPMFSNKIFENGEIYLYEIEDTKALIYKQIPNQYCRLCSIEDGVLRYEVNFNNFTDITIVDYPIEFQNIYNKIKENKSIDKNGRNKLTPNQIQGWYQISNKGFAFSLNSNAINNIPPFCFLFPDIIDLEEVKANQVSDYKDDNVKIIHSKVPIDAQTGLPVMDIDLVEQFNNKVKNQLPKGYASIANPFDTDVINLKQSLTKEKDMSEITKNMVYQESGISDMLFANDKSSSEALKKSIETDAQLSYNLILPMYEAYINYKLKSINSVYKWKINLLRVSYFNRSEVFADSLKSLNLGGSRLLTLALLGQEPLQAINSMKLEQNILDIDSIMIPPKSTFTQSGDDPTEEGGRPKAETQKEIKDNAEKSLDNR